MCEIDFDGVAEVWEQRLVTKSRKEHFCHGCGGTIPKGSSYIQHFSVYDGEAAHERMCLPCNTIMGAFQREHGRMVNPESLFDFLRECLDEEGYLDYDVDDLDPDDPDDLLRHRSPSRLSDEGLRWKYAMEEISQAERSRQERSMTDLATAWRPFEVSRETVEAAERLRTPVKYRDQCDRCSILMVSDRMQREEGEPLWCVECTHERALRNGMPPSGRWA